MPKVLIVDDNLTNVQVLAQIVSQIAEIEVVTYTDSGAALAWAAGSAALEPWLVIVDQNMPARRADLRHDVQDDARQGRHPGRRRVGRRRPRDPARGAAARGQRDPGQAASTRSSSSR